MKSGRFISMNIYDPLHIELVYLVCKRTFVYVIVFRILCPFDDLFLVHLFILFMCYQIVTYYHDD